MEGGIMHVLSFMEIKESLLPVRTSDEQVVGEIWNVMTRSCFMKSTNTDLAGAPEHDYKDRIAAFVRKGEPVRFVMIAFPFKMWRNPLKTARRTPDLGELAFLRQIQDLDREIRLKYAPGTHWVILTEGEAYRELMGVPQDEVRRYLQGIRRFAELLNASELFSFVCFGEILGRYPDFPDRVEESGRAIRLTMEQEGRDRYRDFFTTFFSSVDVTELPPEFLRKVYPKPNGHDLSSDEERWLRHIEHRATDLMVRYLAINDAKHRVGDRGAILDTFPDHLYVSITRKVGRYALHPIHRKTRYFPHHGVPIVEPGGRVSIQWLCSVQENPGLFEPVFWDGDVERLPFAYRIVKPV